MRFLIQDLSLNAHSYLDLFLHGSNSSLTTIEVPTTLPRDIGWKTVSFVVSIKSMHEFAWYRVTCLKDWKYFEKDWKAFNNSL